MKHEASTLNIIGEGIPSVADGLPLQEVLSDARFRGGMYVGNSFTWAYDHTFKQMSHIV